MNIGMCLHPIDPAIRGGDHRVSRTQTEHDISLASESLTHTHTHTPLRASTFTHLHVAGQACTLSEKQAQSFMHNQDFKAS